MDKEDIDFRDRQILSCICEMTDSCDDCVFTIPVKNNLLNKCYGFEKEWIYSNSRKR